MENGKVHIRQLMQWEVKQGNSGKMTFDKICSVFDKIKRPYQNQKQTSMGEIYWVCGGIVLVKSITSY